MGAALDHKKRYLIKDEKKQISFIMNSETSPPMFMPTLSALVYELILQLKWFNDDISHCMLALFDVRTEHRISKTSQKKKRDNACLP